MYLQEEISLFFVAILKSLKKRAGSGAGFESKRHGSRILVWRNLEKLVRNPSSSPKFSWDDKSPVCPSRFKCVFGSGPCQLIYPDPLLLFGSSRFCCKICESLSYFHRQKRRWFWKFCDLVNLCMSSTFKALFACIGNLYDLHKKQLYALIATVILANYTKVGIILVKKNIYL